MSEITMCDNIKCPLNKRCYRAQKKPDKYWQSLSTFKYDKKKKQCGFYLPIKKDQERG